MTRAHICRYAAGISLAAFCWLGMQWIHEAGHVLGGIASGGKLEQVVLDPWTFSRTDMDVDPHPLITAWSGPAMGAIVPLLAFAAGHRSALLRLFAAFCLLANGAYLFFGSFGPIADAATLLHHGFSRWSLMAAGTLGMAGAAVLWALPGGRELLARRGGMFTAMETRVALVLAIAMAVAGSLFFREG